MATVNKDFKVKYGLVVEGSTATVNGHNILTESQDSQDFIIDIIGGETLITSVDTTDFKVTDGELKIDSAVSDLARTGDITTAIGELTTADIPEYEGAGPADPSGPFYFTTERVDSHLSGGDGITYTSGVIAAELASGGGLYSSMGQTAIDRTTTDTWYDANGAAAAVAGDLTDHENATEAHGATGAVVGTTNTQTLTNKTLNDPTIVIGAGLGDITITNIEIGYLDGLTSGIQGQLDDKAPLDSPALTGTPTAPTAAAGTNSTQVATTAYTDAAVAALVDGAPELLDTLNELAAAIGDDENFAANLATSVGERVAKAGDTMTGALVLHADPVNNLEAATKQYVDTADSGLQSAIDAKADAANPTITGSLTLDGSGDFTITSDANIVIDANTTAYLDSATAGNEIATQGYADGLAVNYDAAGSAATAETNANSYTDTEIGLLDTDDIEEGSTNLYFTDYRATQAAATLLTGATKTNIEITGDGSPTNPLVITAENGVADSDTDDLTEGTTNLYFTDVRAVDALEAVVPNFTEVDINSLAKQIAATVSAPTGGSQITAYSFNGSEYRSAKFLVKTAYSTHTELSEVLLTLDTSNNIAITEYAIVGTNGSSSTITADVEVLVSPVVRLRVTPTNNDSTITVVGTLLA
jgi:hypothetical protein